MLLFVCLHFKFTDCLGEILVLIVVRNPLVFNFQPKITVAIYKIWSCLVTTSQYVKENRQMLNVSVSLKLEKNAYIGH